MAAYEDGSYSSTSGIALIGKVLAGRCEMHYTRAAVGKGAIPEGTSPKDMTEPAGFVMNAMIAAVTNPVDGECQVTVQINSSNVEHGFYCTGILLYAEDPDEGEVPYTYLLLESGPEWIRPASSAVGKLATFDLIAAVGDVDHVTATIDPDSIMSYEAVQQLIKEHNDDPEAHASQIGAAVTTTIEQKEESGEIVSENKVLQLISQYGGGGGIAKEIPFTIKPADWRTGDGTYPIYADITDSEITEEHRPDAVLDEESTEIASAYQLSAAARSYNGYVRLRAKTAPEQEISGILYLIGKGGGGGGSYVLPVATATRLGGVMIGQGVTVDANGKISLDPADIADSVTPKVIEEAAAPDRDVDDMLDEVFGDDEETP